MKWPIVSRAAFDLAISNAIQSRADLHLERKRSDDLTKELAAIVQRMTSPRINPSITAPIVLPTPVTAVIREIAGPDYALDAMLRKRAGNWQLLYPKASPEQLAEAIRVNEPPSTNGNGNGE